MAGKTNARAWIIGAIFLFAAVFVVVGALPRFTQFDSQIGNILVAVFAGIVPAAFCFGALKSTGTFEGKKWGTTFQFGGSAALFAVVFLAVLVYMRMSRNTDFSMTFYFRAGGQVIEADGTFSLLLDERKEAAIQHGGAYPQHIPAKWADQIATYTVQIPGFRVIEGQSPKKLSPGGREFIEMEQATTKPVTPPPP